jgi:purine-binding chemotaxis protein CheW
MSTTSGEARSRGQSAGNVRALAGKYLTFVLADSEYGLAVRKVREIIKVAPITTVPQVAPWIKGVLNLRGKVVPIVDLRLRFNLPAADYTDRTCIIVVEVVLRETTVPMGVIVDSVSDVLTLSPDDLEEAPDFGDRLTASFVEGLAKVKGSVKILLNLDHVCSEGEIAVWTGSAV